MEWTTLGLFAPRRRQCRSALAVSSSFWPDSIMSETPPEHTLSVRMLLYPAILFVALFALLVAATVAISWLGFGSLADLWNGLAATGETLSRELARFS